MINASYLPRTAIVFFVESSALIGTYEKKKLFRFQNFNLTQISVLVNGVSTTGTPTHANYGRDDTHGITIAAVMQKLYDTQKNVSHYLHVTVLFDYPQSYQILTKYFKVYGSYGFHKQYHK